MHSEISPSEKDEVVTLNAEKIAAFNAFLAKEIPLTQAVGIRLKKFDGDGLVVTASIEGNTNDKQTVFAGSLATLVTLSGWAMTHLLLSQYGISADVMVTTSQTKYRKPVTADYSAVCPMPDVGDINTFVARLKEKGKARWELSVEIRVNDLVAVEYKGCYVAIVRGVLT